MGPAGSGVPSYTAIFQYQQSPSSNYTGVYSTFVDSANPTTSYGGNSVLTVASGPASTDWIRSLLWFDVRSLPAGAEVQGAYLKLWMSNVLLFDVDTVSVGVHEVRCPWDETATWNQRFTSVPWGCRPGDPSTFTKGAHFAAAPMDSVRFHALSPELRFLAWNLTPSLVQSWVDDLGANFGVALVSEREGTDPDYSVLFSGRPGADYGPSLVVTYTVP
jgi:hypothetical protein